MLRLRLDLGYDGTAFSGWASQPGQRTVQDTVERAISTILRVPVRLTVAGRTDAGVHATGQVAHVDVPAQEWEDHSARLLRQLAGVLPADIRVRAVAPATAGFDARFSALSRRYVYRLGDAAWGVPPLRRHDTAAWGRRIDLEAARQASSRLLGEQDFAAFCRRRDGATTIRTLQRLDWRREDDGILTATAEADAFCHSMVRSLVGAVLAVGEGRRPVDWPAALLAMTERCTAVPVAPAHGLTLVHVSYPEDGHLLRRAQVTRAQRSSGGARPAAPENP